MTSMRWVITIVAAAAIVPCVAPADQATELTPAERQAGWRLLFDGRSADAFLNYREDGLSAGWQIRDGGLVRVAKGAGDIITKDRFGAFELQL